MRMAELVSQGWLGSYHLAQLDSRVSGTYSGPGLFFNFIEVKFTLHKTNYVKVNNSVLFFGFTM
jgi:hypothetical protein